MREPTPQPPPTHDLSTELASLRDWLGVSTAELHELLAMALRAGPGKRIAIAVKASRVGRP